jgi:hypothetical protein
MVLQGVVLVAYLNINLHVPNGKCVDEADCHI